MWHYAQGETAVGPVDEEELKRLITAGVITERTKLWREGMPDWLAAGETELKTLFAEPSAAPAAESFASATVPEPVPGVQTVRVDSVNLTEMTKALRIALILTVVVAVIAIWSGWLQYELLQDANDGLLPTEDEATANDLRQSLIGVVQLLLFIITGVLFLVWIYRANKNVRALGAEAMQFTPGWSIGWYFIPVANLWKPYQAMKEIWNASHAPADWDDQDGDSILTAWWTFWLISSGIGNLAFRLSLDAESIDALIASTLATLASDVIDIPLSLIALALVTRIYEAQMRVA